MEKIKQIYIYGIRGHGQVVADIATACGYQIAGWIDDAEDNNTVNWETFQKTHTHCTIALGVGNNHLRQQIAEKVISSEHHLAPALVHPSSVVSPSAIIDQGSVVMPLVVINANSRIGIGVIINSASVIEHDTQIGDYAHISPNVSLAGTVTIGERSHIGIGTSIIQNITIGKDSIIGAGSVVITNIPKESTAVGVPCKLIHP